MAVVCVLAWVTGPWWLSGVGYSLVSSSDARKADAILVLAGDASGKRILKACDLLRQGLAPVAFVSGPFAWYGMNEADAAIRYAGQHGCDVSGLRPLPSKARSTVEEARAVHEFLRHKDIRVPCQHGRGSAEQLYARKLVENARRSEDGLL
jgi:hypothetical protein